MPGDACVFFFQCVNCDTVPRPLAGDCCVFCSYADKLCPIKQQQSTDPRLDRNMITNVSR